MPAPYLELAEVGRCGRPPFASIKVAASLGSRVRPRLQQTAVPGLTAFAGQPCNPFSVRPVDPLALVRELSPRRNHQARALTTAGMSACLARSSATIPSARNTPAYASETSSSPDMMIPSTLTLAVTGNGSGARDANCKSNMPLVNRFFHDSITKESIELRREKRPCQEERDPR